MSSHSSPILQASRSVLVKLDWRTWSTLALKRTARVITGRLIFLALIYYKDANQDSKVLLCIPTEDCNAVRNPDVSASAHALLYLDLVNQKRQGEWDVRFLHDGRVVSNKEWNKEPSRIRHALYEWMHMYLGYSIIIKRKTSQHTMVVMPLIVSKYIYKVSMSPLKSNPAQLSISQHHARGADSAFYSSSVFRQAERVNIIKLIKQPDSGLPRKTHGTPDRWRAKKWYAAQGLNSQHNRRQQPSMTSI